MGGTFAFSCLKDFVQQYDYREIMFLLSAPGAHCYRIMESNALCKAGAVAVQLRCWMFVGETLETIGF